MRNLLVALLLTMLVACGGSTPPPAPPVTNTAPPPAAAPAPAPEPDSTSIAGLHMKMSKFADDMCACKDSPCAQGVADAMTKWGQDMTKNAHQPPKMTEQETKDFTQLGERMGKCMQAAMGGGSTPAP